MGLNYGLILSAWGLAGLIGPILVARARDLTGSFTGMLPFIAMVLLVSVILPFITKNPRAMAGADRHSPRLKVTSSGTLVARLDAEPTTLARR
jgi:hypothetical protein